MSTTEEPVLAPPGAGLPAIELWVARALFTMKRLRGTRQAYIAEFEKERAALRGLLASCDPAKKTQRVLIPRLPGLEDSSRHWSVWMTLEHLRITNTVFAMVITSLLRGSVPQRQASTAAVKPGEILSGEVEHAFEDSCDSLLATAASAKAWDSPAKYAHPWFGPLDATGWLALSAMHMGIHRKQLRSICSRL